MNISLRELPLSLWCALSLSSGDAIGIGFPKWPLAFVLPLFPKHSFCPSSSTARSQLLSSAGYCVSTHPFPGRPRHLKNTQSGAANGLSPPHGSHLPSQHSTATSDDPDVDAGRQRWSHHGGLRMLVLLVSGGFV